MASSDPTGRRVVALQCHLSQDRHRRLFRRQGQTRAGRRGRHCQGHGQCRERQQGYPHERAETSGQTSHGGTVSEGPLHTPKTRRVHRPAQRRAEVPADRQPRGRAECDERHCQAASQRGFVTQQTFDSEKSSSYGHHSDYARSDFCAEPGYRPWTSRDIPQYLSPAKSGCAGPHRWVASPGARQPSPSPGAPQDGWREERGLSV